ncbi:BON domain-containing protein [Candidatus Tisiphia endosymbiont of Nemotelus uliginosus]|uniref:BON domain-containing protein n=1 Tax=Candidatus Tisiphia endosymbiont of Nemotelus uliginosus TaxID=3077926 RepID=UPI0035C8DF4B
MPHANIILIVLSFCLTGCLPAVFVGAASTTIVAAKDQTLGETVDDMKISAQIKASFIKNNFRELYTKIKVEVEQARVLFTGIIDSEDDALKAVELVWAIAGVEEVINELIIDKKSDKFDLGQYTRDTMITTQIKTKTFLNRNIKFVNYTIVTVKDVVYIFGMARSEEELEQVSIIASQVKGVERVVCHAKIQQNIEENRHD